MRLNELKTLKQVLAKDLKDPAFRARWERSALARAVALCLVAYRAEHKLSQAQLAHKLGMKQPMVERLEAGEMTDPMKSYEEWRESLRNYAWLSDSPSHATDLDFVKHAHGPRGDRVLVLEFKDNGNKGLATGQFLLFVYLSTLPGWSVFVVKKVGKDSYLLMPVKGRSIRHSTNAYTKEGLKEWVETWWENALKEVGR